MKSIIRKGRHNQPINIIALQIFILLQNLANILITRFKTHVNIGENIIMGKPLLQKALAFLREKITFTSKEMKEIKELCNDLKNNLQFEKIKVDRPSADMAKVYAEKPGTQMTVDLNFAKRTLRQETESQAYIMSFLPNHTKKQTIKGTIDGEIKQIKTIDRRSGNGAFQEVTEYENCVSGNKYKRVKINNSTQYYKYIDGAYTNLFPRG